MRAERDGMMAEAAEDTAEAAHREIPARLPLGELAPEQQVLDTEVKLITHGIRMAAYNTMMTLAREIRTNTGHARATDEAHTITRSALNTSGDIDTTTPGYLTIRLSPLPTARASKAISELCEHLTTTETHYPGTDLTLRYTIKNNEPTNKTKSLSQEPWYSITADECTQRTRCTRHWECNSGTGRGQIENCDQPSEKRRRHPRGAEHQKIWGMVAADGEDYARHEPGGDPNQSTHHTTHWGSPQHETLNRLAGHCNYHRCQRNACRGTHACCKHTAPENPGLC